MAEMKRNRHILCVGELTQVIKEIVDPLYAMMISIVRKIEQSNATNTIVVLSPEEKEFQQQYLK